MEIIRRFVERKWTSGQVTMITIGILAIFWGIALGFFIWFVKS